MNIGTFDVGLTDPIDIDLHINFLPKNPKVKKQYDIEGFWNDETNELEIFITQKLSQQVYHSNMKIWI